MLRVLCLSVLAAVCAALVGVCSCQAPPSNVVLTFIPQTARAPWAARFSGTVEQLSIGFSAGGVSYPAGSFVLHGGQTLFDGGELFNDVWASSDRGVTWRQINSGAQSYTPTSFAGYTKDSLGRLYKVAGRNAAGQLTNEVWLSTNGGVVWTRRNANNTWQRFPPRAFPELIVNSVNELELAAGLSGDRDTGPGLADLWKSIDQGANWWRETDIPVSSPPGRSSASLLQHASPALAYKSVLWYFGGYSRYNATAHAYHNDVHISTDYGGSWQAITTAAPWAKRANFNAEVTDSGIIIMTAGYNDFGPGGRDNDLNDVWASLDGGWTWGLCAEDASFSDRRWQMTLLDNEGYLYVVGGDVGVNNSTQPRTPVNDVWRSSFSLNDAASVSRMCNVSVPVCGPGLRCLPDGYSRVINGRVTCAATELCTSTRLGFNVLTSSAQWSNRHTAGLEITTAAVSAGGRSYAAGSMVLWGGVGLDVATNNPDALLSDSWVSDTGAVWAQVSAAGFAGAVGSAHCTNSKGHLFKIGGERNNAVVNDVWMSTTTGRTWTKQNPSSAARVFSARAFADVYADSADNLFLIGGRGFNYTAAGMNDVWMSSNSGRDWTRKGVIPFGVEPAGRFSASLLITPSKLLRKDILTYIGGYSRVEGGAMDRYFNDVWVSSTAGTQWMRITATAPFAERDNFNAEVTKDGYLVVVGGYNNREALNDVWISADGGYSWGQCNAEAQFSDRRWQMTVMDRRGFLYVAGGEEVASGRRAKQSDVYRSTVSMTAAKSQLTIACPGVRFPTCTSGLSCWPGTQSMTANNGATCSTLKLCNLYPDEESSSSSTGDMPPATEPSSDGLSAGTIALIVVIVAVGVLALGFYVYKRHSMVSGGGGVGSGQEGLLSTGETSSLPSTTAFHTLATEQHS